MGNITCVDERRGSRVCAYTHQRIRMARADAAGCEPRSDLHRDAEQWCGVCVVGCALFKTGGQTWEDLRVEEWKVDVPTIGRVYAVSHMRVVCYLSGLGRPFSSKENDLESDTCWFRRAWTLQETRHGMIIGGDTGDDRFIEKEVRARVENRLSLLEGGVSGRAMPVFVALSEMRKRGVNKFFGQGGRVVLSGADERNTCILCDAV